ncbi:MAG: hypothetical protein SF052_07930 [Bacteroidia bacterium]|nr:hypothetical protein [Bacteroidia bacterium]
MDKAELENIIREVISVSADETGWANLAKIGILLRKKGVKYGKLSRFFVGYTHIVETRVDESVQPPIAYARLMNVE